MEESSRSSYVAPLNVHPPDPNHPKGLAFLFSVGMVDPRPGDYPRQPMAIVQSWEPTAELYYQLGVRWHPELATKWAVGGGQFEVAEIVDEKPAEADQTLEQGAEEVLELLGTEHPEYVEMLKQIRESGSPEEKAKLVQQFRVEINKILGILKYLSKE